MHDTTQIKPGLEKIGVILVLMTFLTVAIATFVVANDFAELRVARDTSALSQGSRLAGVFN